jgi:hypothetical protein
MITGGHAIIYSQQADDVRALFRDTLGFNSIDAGDGWLIFGLPSAEVAMHPTEGPSHHELYLLCDDINERFSSCVCLADLQYVDGLGELAGAPGAAAELMQDVPGLELGVRALAG